MTGKDSKGISYVLFGAVALFWGLSFLVTKEALEKLDTIEVLAVRWGISMVFFLIIGGLKLVKLDFRGKNLKKLLLVVLFQPCTYSILECFGIDLTTATESAIIIAAVPIMVVLEILLIFRAKPGKAALFGVLIGFSGVVLCILPGAYNSEGSHVLGYLLLLGAVSAGAGYNIGTSRLSGEFSVMEISCAMAFGGGIFFNLLSIISGRGLHPYKVFLEGGAVTLELLFLGIFCGVLCYAMYNYNLGRFHSTAASCIQTNSINVVGVSAGIIFLGDPWGWYTVAGLIMASLGIVICAYGTGDRAPAIDKSP